MSSLYGLTLAQMRSSLKEAGLAPYASDQVYDWIYRKLETNPDNWSNVSNKVKNFLTENFSLELPKIVWKGESRDGTLKFLLQLYDGQTVETVVIPAVSNRLTQCLSTQVGCAIGCTFCHTGTMGLKRHMSDGEIVGQLIVVAQFLKEREQKLTNIVYMGQGEPLHNYEPVKRATKVFMEDKGLNLSQRKITLSTSGLVPQIEKLFDFPPVNIAISLHAAHDNIRSELMPINKAYDLKRLFEAIKKIPLKARRRITYEYILIKDLNDGEDDIKGLMNLLDKDKSKVNLIPFNEYPESKFKKPSEEKIKWFQKSLLDNGYTCTVRITKGDDILAACGQLKSKLDTATS